MKKHAFLLITDLHYKTVFNNRKDYHGEMLEILDKLIKLSDNYRKDEYTVDAIFMGDVFDRNLTSINDAMLAMELFRFVFSRFDKVYSLIGNHELSYYRGNIFWYLIRQIKDEQFNNSIKRNHQPLGIEDVMIVPDRIIYGDTTITFNHYGIRPKAADINSRINIGLYHQDIGSNNITKMWGNFTDIEEMEPLMGYNYCFFGHLHKAYGKYLINDHTEAQYLASLGRVNAEEVDDGFLERTIPALIFEDKVFQKIEQNCVALRTREDTMNEELYAKEKKLREDRKIITEELAVVSKQDTLYKTILTALKGTDEMLLFELYHKSIENMREELTDLIGGVSNANNSGVSGQNIEIED